MPDASGHFRPISVPAVPWHETTDEPWDIRPDPSAGYWPTSVRYEEIETQKLRNAWFKMVAESRDHGPERIKPLDWTEPV